jgi:hypothetical protein
MNYPIDDDNLMDQIRSQINLQRKCYKKYKNENDFILIYDPIMKCDQICI